LNSEGCRGSFFPEERGTWIGHVPHIALEITLAGMETGFEELAVKTKTLGLYMLFSVTQKKMSVFAQNLLLQSLKNRGN
jgi:hypothetical protein